MARVLPVLCALFFFYAFACGTTTLSTNVRTITFDSVTSKIDYSLVVETDGTISIPTLTVEFDGSEHDSAVNISPDTVSMDLEVSLNVAFPVKSKSKKPQRTSSAPSTPKPSVSAAFGNEFSPIMAFVSLAAAGLCRGLTQNNRLSFGLFIVVALVLALAAQTDAAQTVICKSIVATVSVPTGWTTQDGLPPFNKTIKKDFDLFLFPPTPSASVAVSSTPTRTVTPTISVTPTVSA